MSDIRRLAVFCGSNPGARPDYADGVRALGKAMCERGIGVVYGGSSVGLMATLADTFLDELGDIIGVIPKMLVDREVANTAISDLRVVGSMHERKALMAELSDGFEPYPAGSARWKSSSRSGRGLSSACTASRVAY